MTRSFRRPVTRLTAAALGLSLAWASLAFGARSDAPADPVRLLHADRGGVSFEVVFGEPDVTPLEGTIYQQFALPGFANSGADGAPSLPERIVWIGIPEGVTARVRASTSGQRFLDGVRPLPRVAVPEDDGSGPPPAASEVLRAELAEEPAYLSGSGDGAVVELLGYSAIRSQRVAAVRLRPVRYDAVRQHLEWPEHIEVRVEFGGFASAVERPASDPAFEPVYRDLVLNYESARDFRRAPGGPRPEARSRPSPAAQAGADFTVAQNWVRVRVRTKGVQRLSGADLEAAGVPVGSVAAGDLRLFARPGLPILPEIGYCDTCDIREVAIRVDDGGDGRLDSGDQVLFFGLGASGWSDDYVGPDSTEAYWIDHPYENDNSYWLTWNASLATAPKRWATRDVAPVQSGAVPAPHFPARIHMEENRVYEPNLYDPAYVVWDQWVWQTLTSTLGALVYRADAPGAEVTEPARLKARFWGIGFGTHLQQLSINGFQLEELSWSSQNRRDADTTGVFPIREANNILQALVPGGPARADQQAFLFWELHYRRRFQPLGDLLEFRSPEGIGPGAPAEIEMVPVSLSALPTFVLLDVTDPFETVDLQGYEVGEDDDTLSSAKALRWHETLSGPRHYFAAAATRFARPRLETAEIRDIRSPAMSADYVVITYDGFEAQAQALANHRTIYLAGVASPRTSVVRISDIYAWYSGGRTDPTAVRNFLYDITVNGRWSPPAPSYVCLLGDASYDFRNNFGFTPSGQPATLVPTWVHGFASRQFLSDDWIADIDIGAFDPSPGDTILLGNWQTLPDFFIGRLPAASQAEASTMIESKVIPYDAGRQFGEWRNRVLLVADDLFQGPNPDNLYGRHMRNSEEIDVRIPSEVDRAKVYLVEYPAESGANKPAANRDILEHVNEGALVWNYFGHGNPFQMADENAFRVGDVPSLNNLDRLTIVFAASCDLGKFDDPTKFGLGEALIKSPLGGAIATFSASEIAFDTQNFLLTSAFYSQLFSGPEQGYPLSLGQALTIAKYRQRPDVNDRKFVLQGDPGTRLAHPELGVRLEVFDDETGAALLDSLPRGRRVRVEGEVHGTRDESVPDPRTDFTGTAAVWVSDSAPLVPFREFPSSPERTYVGNPSTVYRGEAPVENGRFEVRFYVPMEARMGDLGRVRAYVRGADQDGVGFRSRSLAEGTPTEVDSVGPSVDLRFTSPTRYVAPDAELRIVLRDEHGINVTGNSAANSILLTIDESLRFDLTDDFRYDANSYQQGSILFLLPNLDDGNHSVRVTATDNFALGIQGLQNRGVAELDFTVSQAAADLDLQVLPFPSPFRPGDGTEVVINGIAEPSDLSLEVFTTSGRRVRNLAAAGGPGSAQVRWDGRDDFGAVVANGVYILRIEVRPLGGGPARVAEGRVAAFR